MSNPDVAIFFGTDDRNRTKAFNLSVEQTRQLIELFRVQLLKIECLLNSKGLFSEYLSLINNVEGTFFLKHQFIFEFLRPD
jgi:hypothetical protein